MQLMLPVCMGLKALHRRAITPVPARITPWSFVLQQIRCLCMVDMAKQPLLVLVSIKLTLWKHHLLIGELNDLWMYSISSNVWTWVSGSNTFNIVGVYGTKGFPSTGNYPGSRQSCTIVLHPSMNCLFVFGGYGRATSLSQLCLFQVSSNVE